MGWLRQQEWRHCLWAKRQQLLQPIFRRQQILPARCFDFRVRALSLSVGKCIGRTTMLRKAMIAMVATAAIATVAATTEASAGGGGGGGGGSHGVGGFHVGGFHGGGLHGGGFHGGVGGLRGRGFGGEFGGGFHTRRFPPGVVLGVIGAAPAYGADDYYDPLAQDFDYGDCMVWTPYGWAVRNRCLQ
jgi:hypothetical protein